jgi:hypothetical protein
MVQLLLWTMLNMILGRWFLKDGKCYNGVDMLLFIM